MQHFRIQQARFNGYLRSTDRVHDQYTYVPAPYSGEEAHRRRRRASSIVNAQGSATMGIVAPADIVRQRINQGRHQRRPVPVEHHMNDSYGQQLQFQSLQQQGQNSIRSSRGRRKRRRASSDESTEDGDSDDIGVMDYVPLRDLSAVSRDKNDFYQMVCRPFIIAAM